MENENPKEMCIGPEIRDSSIMARGDCPDCGQQCAPECGEHPLGCFFGGFSYGYWIFDPNCTLDHGVREGQTEED
jgi:hypothetical protein